MNKYERARQYFQNILISAAKSEQNGVNQTGLFEVNLAIEALDKLIEIENAQFTHICQSDKLYYPDTFSIFARIVEENNESVTIDRFQKFGALPLKRLTISRADFDRYYRPITDVEERLRCQQKELKYE